MPPSRRAPAGATRWPSASTPRGTTTAVPSSTTAAIGRYTRARSSRSATSPSGASGAARAPPLLPGATSSRSIRQARGSMPPEFSLTTDSIDEQRHVVAVSGEIDLFTAPELKSALGEALESGHTRIVVDLTNTSFLDSTALGVLIGAVKRLRSRDGVLTIVNTDPNIAKTFEITGLDQIFTIRPTRDEAVEALDADEAAA